MTIKENVKHIISTKNINRIKRITTYGKYLHSRFNQKAGLLKIMSDSIELDHIYELEEKNVFFGYYDLQQLNNSKDKILVHIVNKNAKVNVDYAEIAWIDLKTHKYHSVVKSTAWSWQQGSRLRWHPFIDHYILLNNMNDGKYVTQIWDINSGKLVDEIAHALYDVTPDFKYGLFLNFSRLQRLRPGYGYNPELDETINNFAPIDDGVFRIDISSGEVKQLFSLRELSKNIPIAEEYQHYINHISVSPDGKRFLFFHLWTKGAGMSWEMRCYISDIDGNNLKCIEAEDTISHYCWKDNAMLLTTKINKKFDGSAYSMYNVITGEKTTIQAEMLKYDGHPSCLNDEESFVTDTYPLEWGIQHFYRSSYDGALFEELLQIYSDPRLFDETRCDLHPRLSIDNRIITIDSAYKDLKRAVLVFKYK